MSDEMGIIKQGLATGAELLGYAANECQAVSDEATLGMALTSDRFSALWEAVAVLVEFGTSSEEICKMHATGARDMTEQAVQAFQPASQTDNGDLQELLASTRTIANTTRDWTPGADVEKLCKEAAGSIGLAMSKLSEVLSILAKAKEDGSNYSGICIRNAEHAAHLTCFYS